MAALMRAHDWERTSVGSPEAWPAALRVAVNLILASPESMFLAWGTDLTFFFNDAYRPILGPRLPRALGSSLPDVWPDAWEQVRPIVELALAGTASRYDDLPLTTARHGVDEQTWWSFSYSPVLDEDEEVCGFLCVVTETTQRVLSERALQAREKELLLITDTLPVLIAFIDRDLVYRFANRAYEDWFFRSPEEVVGLSVRDLLDEAGIAARRAAFEAALAGEPVRLELDWPHRDGRPRIADIRYLPRQADDGTVDGFYVFVLDVTDRKQAERNLREMNDILERRVAERTRDRNALWQLSSDIMLRCGFDGVIIAVNPAWNEVLGWSEEDLVGSSLFELIHPDDLAHTVEGASASADGQSFARFDNRYRHKNGEYRWISWSTRPDEGAINAVGRDFTDERAKAGALRAAEDALRQAQKMEAIGQLTGGVAHDFNNLLTVIKSSTDLLKRPDLQEERRLRYVGAISDTVDRAAKLTGQLLAFARRQALKPEVFELGRSLTSIGDMVGTLTGSRIDVDVRVPAAACFVDADPSQFDTAIVNMVINARDAMNGQGRLVIAMTEASDIPAVQAHPPVSGAFVAVSITDTGGGIAVADMDRIFEPFFTTKGVGHGTGLGLSQVIGFAKQSGGDVHVESDVGHGTTFTLYLPRVADPGASDAPDVEPEPLVDGHGTCVLVVEDNVDVGRFATQALAELGYATVWAANADEALAELATDAERFDVVFSDVVMPGMDGIDLGHEIRRLYHDLPVVLTSGYSHVLAKNGTYGFELLHKPYSVEQLSRILRKVATWRRRKSALGA
ncbi:Sensor histidine kinase RcsC [Methylobacterium adhaesivum]|uniref:histidine kinase n=1 Tax=Methylobacterium adhaesivum TaxID=333297 RepID=A0ABT8BL73_9HYPH|nr:PAS domain-containing protein [Methylobacterium adhaesivum]MDN3591938.1 PAS domain-containing protein [Methylobacterium adhaesivum]GJD32591.1 Sensor histidine kinase RcsC [Methylobacterium adhaesivum]